jgi:hypothetical protein
MATEAESRAWYEDARRVAARWLGRNQPGASEAQREEWAADVASRVAMRWSEVGPPSLRRQQVCYICTAARHVMLDVVDASRNQIFAQATSLDAQVEGADGGMMPQVSEAALVEGYAKLGASVGVSVARSSAGLDEDAQHLRALLDRIAWAKSGREGTHFWLLWLVELRGVVGARLHGEGEEELAAFDAALARLVLWHRGEEEHAICGDRPTLGAFWREAVARLHGAGELEQQAMCEVFEGLGEQVSMDRLHQWLRRMRVKVRASCEAQGVTYVELRDAMAFEGGV